MSVEHRTYNPTNRVHLFLLALAATVPGFASCESPQGQTPPSSVRDSAGISVHTSERPATERKTLLDVARLVASFGEESNPYDLQNVSEAIRLENGSVPFVDSRAREIAIFVPGGGVRPVASRGNGPGEVSFPSSLQRLPADSFQVYDRVLQKVSVFNSQGELAREIPLVQTESRPMAVFRVSESQFVALVPDVAARTELAANDAGNLGATPVTIELYGSDGRPAAVLTEIRGPLDVQVQGSSMAPVFGLSVPFAASANGTIAFGTGEDPEFFIATPDTPVRRIHRFSMARKPVSRDSLFAILSSDPMFSRQMAALGLEDIPTLDPAFLPELQPAYKDIRVFGGQVWLGSAEPFMLPSSEWQVVDIESGWRGTVVISSDARLLDVSGDHVVLRRTGAMDVQRVEIYEIADLVG